LPDLPLRRPVINHAALQDRVKPVARILHNVFQRILQQVAYIAPGGSSLRPLLHRWRGVNIGKDVWLSQQVYIDELHPDKVSIGDNVSIGLRTSIFTHFYWGSKKSGDHAGTVIIEPDVFIGPHCVILPNVRIGRGSVIKAGTVVTRNVPPGTFWGEPAAEPLAHVTVPLTKQHNYDEFMQGLRPIRKRPKKPTS
jgi:acetyltransferase-like isoleucine patch superfamily enzyme